MREDFAGLVWRFRRGGTGPLEQGNDGRCRLWRQAATLDPHGAAQVGRVGADVRDENESPRGAALESSQCYSLTIGFLHEFFALSVSHLFNAPVQNSRGEHQEGDKPNGVKQIHA